MRIVSQRTQQLARRYISNEKNTSSRSAASLIHNFNRNGHSDSKSSSSRARSRSFSSQTSLQATPEFLREQGIFCENNLLKFDTLHELQKRGAVAFAENPIFGTYTDAGGDPRFEYMNYREFGEKVDQCRTVLKDLGATKFSKIGIISNNRWEWAAISCAAYGMNATVVPMYEAQLPADWTHITNDSECSILFGSTQDIFHRIVSDVLPQTPSVKATICLDADMGKSHAFATLMEAAKKQIEDEGGASSSISEPTPDDLANLIYTSGTTGKPKGVELIHSNTISNVLGIRGMADDVHDFIRQSDRSLAFLPWAHCYGQTCELWTHMGHGASQAICRGVPSLLEDLQMAKPTVLFAVPTLYKKIYDGVHNLIESSSPMKRSLMKKSLSLGRKNVEERNSNGVASMDMVERLQYKVLDKVILSKIRDRFGGNLRHGYVAGAAVPAEIINFMDDIGIPICEGYGLTETSPIMTLNSPYERLPGAVGKPIPGVTVMIMGENGLPAPPGEEGEICCYGPNVMRGYHNNPKATEEVISLAPDGKSRLFHSGDLGRMSEDNWVKVTGRLKEQYKLENGKYICPTPIENAIGMSRYITQVVLCGANRPYNVALVVPDWALIRNDLKIDDSVPEDDLVNDEGVKALIQSDIDDKCSSLKKFEIPQEVAFVAPFTAANNMLTPKMSIKRHMVVREYQDAISSMYGDDIVAGAGDGVSSEDRAAA
uniref:AMP-dependent synthetase/ligase domain-containing protein n=1 Tax=Chaetoceros debilis TaxID=122233 RepID=A0A7S3PYI5_9STRA